jgi:mRNA-degrading endonuclease toxin of MazEF toxin-antitoxin module
MVEISDFAACGLSKHSAVDCFQIRSVSVERLSTKLGVCSMETLEQTKQAVSIAIGIE